MKEEETMGIIKAFNVIYDYITRDDETGQETVSRAVDGVSLDVASGEFIAILGHNGSGKSTLAKHINALLMPTSRRFVGEGDGYPR